MTVAPPAPTASPTLSSSSWPPCAPGRHRPAHCQRADVEQRQHLTLERTIEEFIHDRAVLLVLDNCEHVLVPSFLWSSASVVSVRDSPCWRPVVRPWVARRVRPRPRTARRASGWSGRRRGSIRCRRAAVRRPSRRGTSGIPARRAPVLAAAAEICRGSTACRWRSSWRRRRGCARSGPKLWRTASISASPCSPASPRAWTRGTAASISSSNGPTSCSTPSTSKPSPTWRCSPAASISKQPKSCRCRRPRAPGVS